MSIEGGGAGRQILFGDLGLQISKSVKCMHGWAPYDPVSSLHPLLPFPRSPDQSQQSALSLSTQGITDSHSLLLDSSRPSVDNAE